MCAAVLVNSVEAMTEAEPTSDAEPGLAEGRETGTSSEALARRAAEGCLESFGFLVQRHQAAIFHYLRQFIGNTHDAEDLTQETFLKAFRGLTQHSLPRRFNAWLFTIAKRTALNHVRDRRVSEPLSPNEAEADPGPADCAAARDEWAGLWRVADRLQPIYREVLWLRYAEELSIPEIAQALRRRPIHVRVLLHRARKELQRRWTPRRDGLEHPTTDTRQQTEDGV